MTTFGSSYKTYDKAVVPEGLQHYLGRGPGCKLGNDGEDMRILKRKVQTFATTKNDRGLLMRGPLKEQKQSKLPGPASYDIN